MRAALSSVVGCVGWNAHVETAVRGSGKPVEKEFVRIL
jgi:hypothetical protein